MKPEPQKVPVRVYSGDDHVIIAAPMPGLHPEDISITVRGDRVVIRGEQRGPRQFEMDLILDEWMTGPYYREVILPVRVRGPLANATYGNGVLVLSVPTTKDREFESADFQLQAISPTRGERVGHTGKAINPKSTSEHMKKHNRRSSQLPKRVKKTRMRAS